MTGHLPEPGEPVRLGERDLEVMSNRRHNTQLFALGEPPPGEIRLGEATYRLSHIFKHDFFAATCLYEAAGPGEFSRLVVKFYRTRPFCGLPIAWLGRFSRDHEQAIYAALAGVDGVPRWVGPLGEAGCAIEYIDADPLDHEVRLPPGYFDRLRDIFAAVHERGVAYVDADKLSNILVATDGRPYLVDFQIALRRRDDCRWPLRALARRIVQYLQGRDVYHLYKHKRRIAPGELSEPERRLSARRGGWHRLHRKLASPYRALRRRFLREQYRSGRLVSPTAELEDTPQGEKDSWRKP